MNGWQASNRRSAACVGVEAEASFDAQTRCQQLLSSSHRQAVSLQKQQQQQQQQQQQHQHQRQQQELQYQILNHKQKPVGRQLSLASADNRVCCSQQASNKCNDKHAAVDGQQFSAAPLCQQLNQFSLNYQRRDDNCNDNNNKAYIDQATNHQNLKFKFSDRKFVTNDAINKLNSTSKNQTQINNIAKNNNDYNEELRNEELAYRTQLRNHQLFINRSLQMQMQAPTNKVNDNTVNNISQQQQQQQRKHQASAAVVNLSSSTTINSNQDNNDNKDSIIKQQTKLNNGNGKQLFVNFSRRKVQSDKDEANHADASDEDERTGQSERKNKYLTAKYGQHQMSLIKKRLKIEMWLHDELVLLAKRAARNSDNVISEREAETIADDIEIDLDELLDLEDNKSRIELLQKHLSPLSIITTNNTQLIDKFIDDIIEQVKLL